MSKPEPAVLALLEYRMRAVAIGHLALRHSMAWEKPPSIEILFDGKRVIEGKATAFTNGAIEAAIIHSRALLEFLGLTTKRGSQVELVERGARLEKDDIGIEQFGGLPKLSIEKVCSSYPGPRCDAKAALAYVTYLANKGLAHSTSSFTKHDRGTELLEIAFRGVPVLVANNFYIPLGIEPPSYELQGRARSA